MDITRQYIRQFLNESKKPARKFEDSGYKYAYNTVENVEDGGDWEIRDSMEELESEWNDSYGDFDPNNVLAMKPATSIDKAMVWTTVVDGGLIYPSIDASINGPTGLYALGFEENATIDTITEEGIQELLKTKDLKKAEELLAKAFTSAYGVGYFEGLYEYVSGPMPEEDGMTPGRTLVKNKKQKASVKNLEYYKRKVLADPYNLEKVPEEFKTPELCKIAVENGGYALQFVPDKLKTLELCKLAIERYSLMIKYVPDELKTPELYKFAVEKSGFILKYVPNKFKTLELCKLAVKEDSYALRYVPNQLKEQVKRELGLQY